ncbi:MAG: Methyltransferase domain [Rhodobacteraceae bacterium HLUCCO18]|nr:MAG: Methyltransferase domain [Rhodobacteraceae bacterium HLUCCO18]
MVTATLGQVHERIVFNRRVSVLGEALGALVEPGGDILDVGTGDGQIAKLIAAQAPDTSVRGIDIMARPTSHIPVDIFDGDIIPHPDKSFDVVSFVDVLHHTDDPRILLKEAARVARKAVILKDHFSQNAVDHMTLRFMDWVGNAPHGVVLPYNYGSRADWENWYAEAGLGIETLSTDVPLYPAPFSLLFGRGLHFVARLTPPA